MRKKLFMGAILLLLLALGWHLLGSKEDRGNSRFFIDQTYNFEATRVLNDTSGVGGDTGEVSQTIAGLKAGDADGWYNAWKTAGGRVMALADRTTDSISKGRALLRAHNYYRSAEFFLAPNDPRRPLIWKQNTEAFYTGLDALDVKYERIRIPYGKYHLNAVYYPGPSGSEKRPLLVVIGGYDGTMEELYFSIVAAAYQRGYSVLASVDRSGAYPRYRSTRAWSSAGVTATHAGCPGSDGSLNFRFLLMLEHGGKAGDGVGERAENPGLRQAALALVVQRDPFGRPAVEAIGAYVAHRAGEVAEVAEFAFEDGVWCAVPAEILRDLEPVCLGSQRAAAAQHSPASPRVLRDPRP
jgi:hypothetical protein